MTFIRIDRYSYLYKITLHKNSTAENSFKLSFPRTVKYVPLNLWSVLYWSNQEPNSIHRYIIKSTYEIRFPRFAERLLPDNTLMRSGLTDTFNDIPIHQSKIDLGPRRYGRDLTDGPSVIKERSRKSNRKARKVICIGWRFILRDNSVKWRAAGAAAQTCHFLWTSRGVTEKWKALMLDETLQCFFILFICFFMLCSVSLWGTYRFSDGVFEGTYQGRDRNYDRQ